jgi:hypothetical protein
MSPAAKEKRATKLGHLPETYYHASTHEFPAFADPARSQKYEKDSWHGPAVYMTSDRSDANRNYAGMGPDLTNRVETRASHLVHEFEAIDKLPVDSWVKEKAKELISKGVMPEHWSRDEKGSLAWANAYDDLVGSAPEGVTLALRTNPRNPVYVGGPKDTFFGYDLPEFSVERAPAGHWVVKHPDGTREPKKFYSEDAAQDFATDLRYESAPGGPGARILDRLEGVLSHYGQWPQLRDDLQSHMLDNGGVSAKRLEDALRNNEVWMYALDDNVGIGRTIQDIYRDLGYDAAIMANADKQFKGMGMAPGTTHIALFDPSRVRKTDAAFDPKKVDSTDLLAGIAGGAIALPTLANLLTQTEESSR